MLDIDFPQIIAHRGASAYAPENSLRALELAAEFEATWVEYDVQLTQDKQLVVVHDENLKRLTEVDLNVEDATLAQIQLLTLQLKFPEDEPEKIPSLDQWFCLAKKLGLKHNLEIKCSASNVDETVAAVVEKIKQAELSSEDIVISSFCLSALQLCRDALPDYWLGLNMMRWTEDWQKKVESFNGNSLHMNAHSVTAKRVDAVHAANLKCLAFTVNRRKKAKKLLEMGVDALFSNYPDLLR